MDSINLINISTNNLKHIDAKFPLGKISVVTGVSGSGKSSLVFDTLYAESYRRYVESLSSFARQYLKSFPKPEIERVENLLSAIAVKQAKGGGTNRRSTVGTLTELLDLIRVLFTHLSQIECTGCGMVVSKDSGQSVVKKVMDKSDSKYWMIAAPLTQWKDLKGSELKKQLTAQGFTRVIVKSHVQKIEETLVKDLKVAYVVVDRIKMHAEQKLRLIDSINLGFKLGRGLVYVLNDQFEEMKFSSKLSCADCDIDYYSPSNALFSFNHPLGACDLCKGFGLESQIDWGKVIPDLSLSIKTNGIAALNFGKHTQYYSHLKRFAQRDGFDIEKPFADYDSNEWQWLKYGDGVKYSGMMDYFDWLDRKKYKPHYRMHAAKFRKYVTCSQCEGDRLNEKALVCKLNGLSVAQVNKFPISALFQWVECIEKDLETRKEKNPSLKEFLGAEEAVEEMKARLGYLLKIGVGYLSLDRVSHTLSGGELQRINMARCLGSALTQTLFCLDEPTSGLHVKDSHSLLEVIRELKEQGNTVVIVEHEKTIINGADHVIEVGPEAGHKGGKLVYEGVAKSFEFPQIKKLNNSVVEEPKQFILIDEVTTHNLKNVSARFPVGKITAVCGVSGSGKTSLVQHTLYPALASHLGIDPIIKDANPKYGRLGPEKLIANHGDVMLVSQSPMGKSSRSNIATYLGIYDVIRKIFSAEPLAIKLKLKPGAFSFNVPGGRCETCRGLGTIEEDLSFLGDVTVICPTCEGAKFGEDVLCVTYMGKNLIQVLEMTVSQAREFFHDQQKVCKVLDEVIKMGLGYVTLGQSTSSFSGGEAQRLKLLSLMKSVKGFKPSILIFDEPTTGLSDKDVYHLLLHLQQLCQKGHTIVVIEHHLDVIKSADWVIEVGPEASEKGGEILFQGVPEKLLQCERSVTREYL